MADINVDDITNSGNTGIFDKLMESINTQIENQYLNNRITGSDYATVYLGSMQAALAQSMQFALQEELTEAQVAGVEADNLLKSKQLEIAEVERLSKVYEKDVLLVDQHNTTLKQQALLDTQEEAEQYKVDNLLPAELAQINKQTDVAERGMAEQEATGIKQRILLDTEEEAKQFEVDNILPEQVIKIQEEIDLLQTQDSETLLDGAKKRLIMDEEIETANLQQGILEFEEDLKEAQVAEILDATVRANTELTDKLLTTTKQRVLLDEEAESADKQQLLADAQIKTAYADRVLKDKQAAKLGLDTVMKRSEDAKQTALDNDTSFVYTPNYEE